MAGKREKYRRLPGRSRANVRFVDPSRYQLWMGEDHLLHIRLTYFREDYKRFYLKDIQALVISRTTTGRWTNILLSILTLIFGMLALMGALWWGPPESPLPITFGIMASVPVVGIVINTILGPTCVCRLHTDVQVESLPSLGRLRSARKLITILKPAIEAAQGKLAPEDLGASSEEQGTLQASRHALSQASVSTGRTRQSKRERGKVHAILFSLALVFAASVFTDIFYQHTLKDLLDMILFLVMLSLTIISLVRQHDSDMPQGLKTMTWVLLGVLIGSYISGTAFAIAYMLANPELASQSPFLQVTYEGPVFIGYCAITGIIYSILGVTALIHLARFRAARAASEAVASDAAMAGEEQ